MGNPTLPGRIHGWLVVAASFVGHFLLGMAVWSTGVFHEIFMKAFEAEGKSAEISIISSLLLTAQCGAGLVSSALINTYGEHIVEIFGSILASVGLAASMFATTPLHLCITYGGIAGTGAGLAYVPLISIITKYFDKRREMAMGIAVCGLGMGCLASPPMVHYLTDHYGWRGTMLMLGGAYIHGVPVGLIFRPFHKATLAEEKISHDGHERDMVHRRKNRKLGVLNVQILKNKSFLCLIINNCLYMFSYTSILVHFAAYAASIGHSEIKSAMLLSVFGVSNFLGRLLFGLLAQCTKRWVSQTEMFTTSQLLTAVAVLFWPLAMSYFALSCCMAMFGFLSGGWNCLLPLTIAEILQPRLVASGVAFVLVSCSIGAILGPAATGWLYDLTHYYPSCFYLSGAFILLCVVFMVFPIIQHRRNRHSPDNRACEIETVLDKEGQEENAGETMDEKYVSETL